MSARDLRPIRSPRLAATVAAGSMLAAMGLGLSPSHASQSPSPVPTTTSEGTTNPDFVPPETVDTYVGQSVQSRKTADGVQNAALANFRWNVTQVNAESLNGLDVSVPLPMTDAPGLRSLTGGSNAPTEVDGGVLFDFDNVNGIQTKRTLNLWPQDKELPVDVSASFTLNGEKVNAQDIVGQGGLVTATYTIINKTVTNESVDFDNVKGDPDVQSVDTSQAFVGISKQFIPQSWAQFDPGHGIYGADGRGNFQTQWITLAFLPFAENGEASFGWSAVIPDGQGFIPKMVIEVSPLYVPPHAADEEEPASATDDNGVPKPNLDAATSTVQAGVKDLIAGLSGIADLLPEKDPNAPPLSEKLANLQAGLTSLSTGLNTAIQSLNELIGQAEGGEIGAPIDAAKIQAIIDDVNSVISLLNARISQVQGVLASENCAAPKAGGTNDNIVCNALSATLDDLQSAVKKLSNEVLPALQQVLEYATSGSATITADALTAIVTKLTEAKTSVDAALTSLTNLLNTIAKATDLAALAASGKSQISAGLGMASDEVSAYIGKVVAAAQAAAAEGKTAAAEVEASLNTVKAELAGLKGRMAESPLPYGGGFNTAYAPAGDPDAVQTAATAMLPNTTPEAASDGVVPTAELFGAYQFMLDPADSNKPNTPWRILLAVLFVVGAGFIGKRVASRSKA